VSAEPILSIQGVAKTYASGVQALKPVSLDIRKGEIVALLGPNGAGKTTLISIICGIVRASAGTVVAAGFDTTRQWRQARQRIGLVPQELHTEAFETVWAAVRFSRGLFGLAANDAYLEQVLRDLSLWDKRDAKIMTLSGGMKRRVMIAKALSHEPAILFLDEPTAGVDVELRRDMWALVRRLQQAGTTIILTTHYIEEAEEMAGRVGVIRKGELILVEDTGTLMAKLGKRRLILDLAEPLGELPAALRHLPLAIEDGGARLIGTFEAKGEGAVGMGALIAAVTGAGLQIADLRTEESSLEDIFVELVHTQPEPAAGVAA
jgi:ABC-2 type transport system ATP-binding protein